MRRPKVYRARPFVASVVFVEIVRVGSFARGGVGIAAAAVGEAVAVDAWGARWSRSLERRPTLCFRRPLAQHRWRKGLSLDGGECRARVSSLLYIWLVASLHGSLGEGVCRRRGQKCARWLAGHAEG